MRFVRSGGITVYYNKRGSGSPLLLLHGIGSNSFSWRYQFQDLSCNNTVMAWDAPGYGQSSDPVPKIMKIRHYTNCVKDLLDEEAAPAEAPAIARVEAVVVDNAYSLDAALQAEAAELDTEPTLSTEVSVVAQTETVPENAETVMEKKIASLDAEAAEFDATGAAEAEEDILPPLPPEPEIFLISLATYESEAEALEAWEMISETHAGLLRKLPFVLQPIEMEAGGEEGAGQYVELIVGPLDSPLKSRTLCAALRAHKHVCRTIEK